MHFHRNLLERVVSIKIGLLQVLPLEVLLEGKFVLEPKCAVWVLALKTILEVKDQEEASIDVVLTIEGGLPHNT